MRSAALDRSSSQLEIRTNEIVFGQGDPADSVFYVRSGIITLEKQTRKRVRIISHFVGSRQLFGSVSSLLQSYDCSARALLPSTIVRIPKTELAALQSADRPFAQYLAACMPTPLTDEDEVRIERLSHSLEMQLARVLMLLATVPPGSGSADLPDGLTDEHLARLIGTDPASVRRLLDDFRRAGHIVGSDRVSIRSSLAQVLLPDLPRMFGPKPTGYDRFVR